MKHQARFGAAALALGASLTLAGCATVAEAVEPTFHASLTGAQEVPPADPDGSGSAEISIVDATDNVCFELHAHGIAPATMAHIHRGAAGVSGPPVVTLQAPDADGESKGCVAAPGALADEIKANPAAFYVNIHTAEYPNGAIRGQLHP